MNLLLKRIILISHDTFAIPFAWALAYGLRFNFEMIPAIILAHAVLATPFIMILQATMFWVFGLYRGEWQFASIPDLIRIMKSSVCTMLITFMLFSFLTAPPIVPRSIYFLYTILLIAILSGSRLLFRILKTRDQKDVPKQRALIVGAGYTGERIVRDMLVGHTFKPIIFVDDKTQRQGQEIRGIRVAGYSSDIPDLVSSHNIDLIIIAIPSATATQMRQIVELCEQAAVPFRTVPSLDDILSGRVAISELREVQIEDLLNREAVELDWAQINYGVSNKTILITGAGGSIGSELCRQVANLMPETLILLDNSEYNLYNLIHEIEEKFPDLNYVTYLTSVTDAEDINHIFQHETPDLVFHAAAYKHVPLLEDEPRSAIINNVIGTTVVAEAASRCGCQKFIYISTDKAVLPTNIMGCTKRIGELYCQNINRESKTQFITVRFGNVLDSGGSVVPLFNKQIELGGPVTVTHPEMERYFMTIPEASQLILQSAAIGQGGEIFVLDMGEPINISYLAEQLILLSGKQIGTDIEIVYTGLRPGEKLKEALFYDYEVLLETPIDKILKANYRAQDWQEMKAGIQKLMELCKQHSRTPLLQQMLFLVPEAKLEIVTHSPALARA